MQRLSEISHLSFEFYSSKMSSDPKASELTPYYSSDVRNNRNVLFGTGSFSLTLNHSFMTVSHLICNLDLNYWETHNTLFSMLWLYINLSTSSGYHQIADILFFKSFMKPWVNISHSLNHLINPFLLAHCTAVVEYRPYLFQLSANSRLAVFENFMEIENVWNWVFVSGC